VEYSIYQAKARLSELIRMVKARRRVVITERGVPVAEVVPYASGRSEKIADRIRRLTGTGAVIPPREPFSAEPLVSLPGAVDRFLEHDRE
jgi:prevent-host-death family protein